jgi:hypothetical protein
MIETGLISRLNANSTFNGLLAGRIYPLRLPENPVYPACTYRVVSAVPAYNMDGTVMSVTTRIEFSAWSLTFADCRSVQDAIRIALDRFTGILPSDVAVQFIWRDGSAVDGFDTEARAYSASVDYRLTHTP